MSSAGLCWASVPLRISQMDERQGAGKQLWWGLKPREKAAAEGRINTAALLFLHIVLGFQYLTAY